MNSGVLSVGPETTDVMSSLTASRFVFCVLILITSAAPALEAKRFVVAADGKDENGGTDQQPFATVTKAQTAARAFRAEAKTAQPIAIVLRGRIELTAPLVLTPEDSGTAESPLLFVGEKQGDTPGTLSGGHIVSGFKADDKGRWVAELPDAKNGAWKFETISVNGEMRRLPRLPKTGYFTISGLAGANPAAKYDTPANKFEFASGEVLASWTNLNDVEAVVHHFWVDTHLKIASVDEAAKVVTFDRSSRRKFTDDHNIKKNARYYLRNVYEALAPGEFYMNAQTGVLTVAPKDGENLANAIVVAPKLDVLVRVEGKPNEKKFVEHIAFENIAFSDTAWTLKGKDAGDLQAASSVPGAITFTGAHNCALRGCSMKNVATYAIDIREGSVDNAIERCELGWLGGGGIRINGSGGPEHLRTGRTTVTDNTIHHCGETWHSSVGVLSMHSFENTISHNHIHHLYYTGISAGWVWGYHPSVSRGNKIENNYIHDIGQKVLSDMGAIYTLGPQPGTVIRGNHIHDIDSWSYGGWGIYTDEGSSEILIENNLVYRTKTGGFHQHYGKENIVRNNIFALMTQDMVQNSRAEEHLGFTFEKNILYSDGRPMLGNNWNGKNFKMLSNLYFDRAGAPKFPGGTFEDWQKRGHDVGSIVADPLFVNPAKDDFTLKPESPAFKLGFQAFDVSKAGPRK